MAFHFIFEENGIYFSMSLVILHIDREANDVANLVAKRVFRVI